MKKDKPIYMIGMKKEEEEHFLFIGCFMRDGKMTPGFIREDKLYDSDVLCIPNKYEYKDMIDITKEMQDGNLVTKVVECDR